MRVDACIYISLLIMCLQCVSLLCVCVEVCACVECEGLTKADKRPQSTPAKQPGEEHGGVGGTHIHTLEFCQCVYMRVVRMGLPEWTEGWV